MRTGTRHPAAVHPQLALHDVMALRRTDPGTAGGDYEDILHTDRWLGGFPAISRDESEL